MATTLSYGDIARLSKADPEAFATEVLGYGPKQRMRDQVRYGEKGSLVVHTGGRHMGTFYSFEDEGARGDMLDLYRWHTGGSKHDAIVYAKRILGIEDGSPVEIAIPVGSSEEELKAREEEENAKRIRVARWIWRSASATEGRKEGLAYLRNRGITADLPKDIVRFRRLSAEDLAKMGVKPADIPATPVVSIIFKATNARGEITAVQQVLTTGGRKVAFENPKRTNGLMQGSAVKLGDVSQADSLNLAEGPETALSIWQATGAPTWIALGTSNYTRVEIPSHVRTLTIAADMEESGVGLASALKAAQHWAREGIERSGIALPRVNNGDFNDILQQSGDEAVRHSFETAFYPVAQRFDGTVLVTADSRAAFHAWLRTGVETIARVPPRDKETGRYGALNLDMLIEDRHSRVLLIERPDVEISHGGLSSRRAELEIHTIAEDAKAFRALARTPGAIERTINAFDIHAPSGQGEREPVIFALRRQDADALEAAGAKAIAVRSTAVETVDLGFMAGREAYVAPVGAGTRADARLAERLAEAGADTAMLSWQVAVLRYRNHRRRRDPERARRDDQRNARARRRTGGAFDHDRLLALLALRLAR